MKKSQLNINPVIVKELRSRMRGWRAFAILTAYLIFLALFSYGIYRLIVETTSSGGSGMPLSPFIGQALYIAVANLSLFFVAFLTPALTAGAISSEHEKLTLEMLQATPLSVHTILLGKLISTTGYIFLLLFAAIPIASLVFTFGGVAPVDLVQAALVILATAATFGTIGLFFSAWRKRTIQAIVLSYLVILLFIGGTLVLYIFWAVMIQDAPPRYVLVANPFSALASVFGGGDPRSNPVTGIFGLLAGLGPLIDDPAGAAKLRPLWHYSLAFNLLLSTVLYLLATRFIQPIRPWRLRRRGLSLAALLFLVYGLIGGLVFRQDITTVISPPPRTPTPTPVIQMMPRPVAPPPRMIQPSPIPTSTSTPEAVEEAGEG